jgi:hypothetical protein
MEEVKEFDQLRLLETYKQWLAETDAELEEEQQVSEEEVTLTSYQENTCSLIAGGGGVAVGAGFTAKTGNKVRGGVTGVTSGLVIREGVRAILKTVKTSTQSKWERIEGDASDGMAELQQRCISNMVLVGHGSEKSLKIWRVNYAPTRTILWPVLYWRNGEFRISCYLQEKALNKLANLESNGKWIPCIGYGLDIMYKYIDALGEAADSGENDITTQGHVLGVQNSMELVVQRLVLISVKQLMRLGLLEEIKHVDKGQHLVRNQGVVKRRKQISPLLDVACGVLEAEEENRLEDAEDCRQKLQEQLGFVRETYARRPHVLNKPFMSAGEWRRLQEHKRAVPQDPPTDVKWPKFDDETL